jgi:diguanylate cyclase (GGDEF)-like protein/PAS domain S-box-containing protein
LKAPDLADLTTSVGAPPIAVIASDLDGAGQAAILEAVIRHSPTSVTVVGADDRIVLTMGDTRTTSHTKSTFIGRHLSELLPDASYVAMVDAVRDGEPAGGLVEFGGRTYDSTAVLLPDAVAGPGGVAFIATDVTERVAETRRYQALIENMEEVTSILELDGSVRYVSPAIERLSGYTPAQVMAMTGTGILHPDDVAASSEAFIDVVGRPGAVVNRLYRIRHRDGSWRDIEQSMVNRSDDPAIAGLVAVGRDVTQRLAGERISAKRADQQAVVSTLGYLALSKAEAGELFDTAVAALEPFGERQAILYEVLAGTDQVLVRAASGARVPVTRGEVVERSQLPVTNRVLASGVRLRVDDFSDDARFPVPAESHLFTTGSGVSVPIRVDGQTVAALTVHSFTPSDFDDHELDFYDAVANIMSGAMERTRYENSIRHDALHDRLTGLPNRVLLQDRITQALWRCRRRQSGPLGVIVADLDLFKNVNGQLGHDLGDRLLTLAGERLREAIRPSDTVARLGGDEYVILCEDLLNAHEAATVAERLVKGMRKPFVVDGVNASLTISAGVAVGAANVTAEGLLRDADVAMYRAKETGRDRFELFDEALRGRLAHRADVEAGLRHALEREEFVVAYQPILEVSSGAVREAEALLRWTRPDGTVVSPAEFIPIAEETGLIVAIGEWVLRSACADAVRWNRLFGRDGAVGVGVNLSARQIADPNLVATVIHALHSSGLAPDLLRLEITETALMDDAVSATATLEALDRLGVRLSVDDFGTGYSSLIYLRRFPVRVLKVDRDFVAGLGKNPEDDAIVQAVIALAHSLGLSATAEGVETEDQLRRLQGLDCDLAQGFLWSRALPIAEFTQVVTSLRDRMRPLRLAPTRSAALG